MADFFHAGDDEREAETERAREELEKLRSLTLLAVAQARRTELELRDVLGAQPPDSARLAELVPRLEEERSRANNLMKRYRRRESEEQQRLSRLGQVRLADEINERRHELRGAVDFASKAAREEELVEMEDEARAEAFRLDVLDQLDSGAGYRRESEVAAEETELVARARELLEESAIEPPSEA
ncbi:MAG: hypothetical protein ACOX9R_00530 [Armatimonadota bacterium]